MPFIVIAAAAAAADVSEEASAGGLPQFDPSSWPSQLFWLAVTFGVLYFLLSSKFLPAIGAAIEERRDRIADDLDQAGEFKRQAEEAESAYNEALADAKAKARTIAADTRAAVDQDIADMQAKTDAALEDRLAAAEASISEMKDAAADKVREAATDTAAAIVEALLDESPTPESVQKAIASASSPT